MNREKGASAGVKTTALGASKQRANNTDKNKTDKSKTDIYPILSEQTKNDGRETANWIGSDETEQENIRRLIQNNPEYDVLLENNPCLRNECRNGRSHRRHGLFHAKAARRILDLHPLLA